MNQQSEICGFEQNLAFFGRVFKKSHMCSPIFSNVIMMKVYCGGAKKLSGSEL